MTKYIGEEIQTLNEGWTLFGARIDEWLAGAGSGFLYLIIVQLFFRQPQASDAFVLILFIVGVTYLLRTIRSRFPDEKRGMLHAMCDLTGITPPDIPPPASFRKYWSGIPSTKNKHTQFIRLGFDKLILELYQKNETKLQK